MTIQEHLSKMKRIYNSILGYIEDQGNSLMNFPSLIRLFDKLKIGDNLHLLKTLLHILVKVSNNHYNITDFFSKIEEIIKYFKDQIKNYFPNCEIFDIFKSNKRILLFLLEEEIMIIDEYIFTKIISEKYDKMGYPKYFQPEINAFTNEKVIKNLPSNFYEKRKSGQNDNIICKLIRNDSIDEFSSYIETNYISLNDIIEQSIFETNEFLIKQSNTKIIEYAAFFGSIKIFKYLIENGVELINSLWLFVIHSHNAEMIHILEENDIEPEDQTYIECFDESIKCHHKDIAYYILQNFLNDSDESSQETIVQCLKYYNLSFMKNELINDTLFYYLCQYDYTLLVDAFLQNGEIDINKGII